MEHYRLSDARTGRRRRRRRHLGRHPRHPQRAETHWCGDERPQRRGILSPRNRALQPPQRRGRPRRPRPRGALSARTAASALCASALSRGRGIQVGSEAPRVARGVTSPPFPSERRGRRQVSAPPPPLNAPTSCNPDAYPDAHARIVRATAGNIRRRGRGCTNESRSLSVRRQPPLHRSRRIRGQSVPAASELRAQVLGLHRAENNRPPNPKPAPVNGNAPAGVLGEGGMPAAGWNR